MNSILETETHASGHSVISWLKPDKNPFYLISISAVFTLTWLSRANSFVIHWGIIYWLIGITLMINIILSIIPQEIEKEQYDKNLLFARTIGITSAILSLIFLSASYKEDDVFWMFVLVFIQIIIFTIYIFISLIKRKENFYQKKKKINNFQLCMTTSVLLMGIMINYANSNKQLPQKNEIVEKADLQYQIGIIKEELTNFKSSISFVGKANAISYYTLDSTEYNRNKSVIDDALDMMSNTSSKEITSENEPKSVVKLLLFSWIICISIWVYQLRTIFNLSVQLNNSPD